MHIEEILGKQFTDVTYDKKNEEIIFTEKDGTKYRMYHEQDCCEYVGVDDINGDLKDLTGSVITLAEETTNHDNPKDEDEDSFTWTFYRLATVKGYVDIKWYGVSNGYYSESVDFEKMEQ